MLGAPSYVISIKKIRSPNYYTINILVYYTPQKPDSNYEGPYNEPVEAWRLQLRISSGKVDLEATHREDTEGGYLPDSFSEHLLCQGAGARGSPGDPRKAPPRGHTHAREREREISLFSVCVEEEREIDRE